MKSKIILNIMAILYLSMCLVACKHTELKKCYLCGQKKQCYQVAYRKNKKIEKYWVCSEECHKKLNALATILDIEIIN